MRGRPTIGDNFLLGSRNAWVSLLEQSWQEIGLPLLQIRDRRSSTIEDIRTAFEILNGKPNWGLAAAFLRDSIEAAEGSEIRGNRKLYEKVYQDTQNKQFLRDQFARDCADAEAALREASPEVREQVQSEAERRKTRLAELEAILRKAEEERDALDRKLRDQEAYFSRKELLDYLHSRRYAVEPRNLANALAGLPTMRWRQSFSRSSKMRFMADPHLWYQVFVVIESISKRCPNDTDETPVEFFRVSILELSKKTGYVREYLGQNWRFLRLAIEECWISKPPIAAIPFVVTSLFVQKLSGLNNPVERVLASEERLIFS